LKRGRIDVIVRLKDYEMENGADGETGSDKCIRR
jgi:hypothetical protein